MSASWHSPSLTGAENKESCVRREKVGGWLLFFFPTRKWGHGGGFIWAISGAPPANEMWSHLVSSRLEEKGWALVFWASLIQASYFLEGARNRKPPTDYQLSPKLWMPSKAGPRCDQLCGLPVLLRITGGNWDELGGCCCLHLHAVAICLMAALRDQCKSLISNVDIS